jgi:hypothetical protein
VVQPPSSLAHFAALSAFRRKFPARRLLLFALAATGCSTGASSSDREQPSSTKGGHAGASGGIAGTGLGGSGGTTSAGASNGTSSGASGSSIAGASSIAGNGATAGGSAAGGATSGAGGDSGGTETSNAGQAGATGSAGSSGTVGMAGSAGSQGEKFCGISASASAAVLAFPGAQGFGKNATGARAGKLYHVTNLNDSGSGSFRDAVSAASRFVVFDVGGYVSLKTAVSVSSNVTIAGQTAPGQGIGFKGGEISFANQANVIMRHVRVRPGSDTASDNDDALSLFEAKNVMIDHCSFEFAPWNDIDGVSTDWQNHPATDITFQDSIIADPTGQQFGAHTESVGSNWAWYRNIFANSHNRNPLAKVNTVFVNNLEYNNQACYTTHTSTNFQHDIVNNYFVYGPSTSGDTWFQIDKNQAIYYDGNLLDSDVDGALGGTTTTPYWYQGTGTVLTSPWSPETTAVPPLTTASAARVAMSRAGTLPRDPVDALVVSQVLTLGKGSSGTDAGSAGSMYATQSSTGLDNDGYGTIGGGQRATDTDDDGMPDAWESATGTDPNTDDAMTKASDGYANLEHYVNWLAEPHATTAAGQSVDVDLAAYALGFSTVAPTFSVTSAQNGTVTLGADGHTARFVPGPGCYGFGTFSFSVKGSDGSASTDAVVVLVTR